MYVSKLEILFDKVVIFFAPETAGHIHAIDLDRGRAEAT
jgi:hypothetical protein